VSTTAATVVHPSPLSFDDTLARLLDAIGERGLTLFARVDHAANARTVGLQMPPTVLILFGNPSAGTPLMQASPDFALELPSRLLVREADDGTVSVLHHDADALGSPYGLRPEQLGGLRALAGFVDAALAESA
jgi:uncharacterized protein (DUF302 family)